MMKLSRILLGLGAMALAPVAMCAPTQAPIYKISTGATLNAQGVIALDAAGNPTTNSDGSTKTQPIQGVVTNMTLVSGTPLAIDLRTYSGGKIQLIGLSADSLLVEQSMDGIAWVTAYLMKADATAPFAATAITGVGSNGIYSVYGFAGELRLTRTGSADTLTVKVRGSN